MLQNFFFYVKVTDSYEDDKNVEVQQPPMLAVVQGNRHFHTFMVVLKLPQSFKIKKSINW